MEISLKALVLAAGKGTRLHTEGVDLPKVLRQAAGRPLLAYVLDALSFLPAQDTILVVGWMKDQVTAVFPGYPYAVQCAAHLLTDPDGHVLVCYGDTPLMRAETYRSLIDLHLREGNACTLLSSHLEEGGNYGRVIRGADGSFSQVVEAKDCTPEQAAVAEVNVGVYVFRVRELLAALDQLTTDNAQGELYITDAPALIQAAGGRVGVCDTCSAQEMLGVNTVEQLAEVERVIRARAGH